jgi:hypothetical protein
MAYENEVEELFLWFELVDWWDNEARMNQCPKGKERIRILID